MRRRPPGLEGRLHFGTTGTNRYPDDLTFLCFPLDNLNVGKLAMFTMRMGDSWFDDIVDNDLRREGRIYQDMLATTPGAIHGNCNAIPARR